MSLIAYVFQILETAKDVASKMYKKPRSEHSLTVNMLKAFTKQW